MKRFLKKALRWTAITIATLAVLLLAFYAEEDWRGARDWAACQRDLAAKGETLDLRQLVPPGNPADDLSKVPIFAEKLQQPPIAFENILTPDTRKPTHLDRINIYLGLDDYDKYPKNSNYLKGQPLDLGAWQKFYRSLPVAHLPEIVGTPAQDVLQTLSQFDPEWNEVETAINNPNAYWPIDYEKPLQTSLSGITSMIRLAQVLPLKAVAHLENHETDLAEKDYLSSFQFNRSLTKGCWVINYLVMMGVRAIDNAILWEGLHRHAWNDGQLREMESALASEDMLATAEKCFRDERASALQSIKYTQARDPRLLHNGQVEPYLLSVLEFLRIRPNGWWDEDRLNYALGMQQIIESIDLDRCTLRPQNADSKESILNQIYLPLSTSILPVFRHIDQRIAQAETYRRLARLTCRLEEYRLAHNNQYPEKLADLPDLPPHLNQEVLSEQPLQYHRQGDGYQLYSLGWDQKDDGGMLDSHNDKTQGDWPWPSP